MRINRGAWWAGTIPLTLTFSLLVVATGPFDFTVLSTKLLLPLAICAAWALLWMALAIGRLHDLNISGWWAPIYLISSAVAGVLYQIREPAATLACLIFSLPTFHLAFKRGTNGPNRFGPDPRAPDKQLEQQPTDGAKQ